MALGEKVKRPLFADFGRQAQEHDATGEAVEWRGA